MTGTTFSGEITFEAILYESSNSFILSYQDATWSGASGYDYGASATVGIRDTSGQTSGRYLLWSYNSGVLANSYSILFTTPEPGTFALFGVGAAGLAAAVRWRRKNRGARADGDARRV